MIDLHVHSLFSDGKDSPEDIVKTAIKIGLREVALCEHVRQNTHWFTDYPMEVQRLKKMYGKDIIIYSAVEAKVVDFAGNIDARPEFFAVDIVYAAVHRIPMGEGKYCIGRENSEVLKRNWLSCLNAVILRNVHVTALAHPFLPAIQYGLDVQTTDIENLAEKIADSKKAVEINLKYKHGADEHFFGLLAGKVPFLIGSDSHSIQEMQERKQELENAWRKWGKFCALSCL